ncbi:hypothetical protein DENIS_0705 [Desulfonema ishimotonii]|uniref:Guanylate cyclase domain-containing protein n=1 Tax=Desulfonema ishimotonii TaxID=45657 RepID=A0A401FS28_9BACT|nr:hypothetical protein [Desulfonema ishimotonii]GBC59764.1 hypothetical protein DENIS_0705 [Desulfonema ishimotonii]
MMPDFSKFSRPMPTLAGLQLRSYSVNCSMDRLKTGIDNLRHDVYLSEEFAKSVRHIVSHAISRVTRMEATLASVKKSDLAKDKERFKENCKAIMLDAVNAAKLNREAQIDILAQFAIIKLLRSELHRQYNALLEQLKQKIRGCEIRDDHDGAVSFKKKMNGMAEEKEAVISEAGNEIFSYFRKVQLRHLNEMRRINFGDEAVIPDNFFANPMLFRENPADDFFTLKKYEILLGHRLEDPDKYDALTALIRGLLIEIETRDMNIPRGTDTERNFPDSERLKAIDGWLQQGSNVDLLFNCFQSEYQYERLRKEKKENGELARLKASARHQRVRLNYFYKKFKRLGILRKIVASYEMQPLCFEYCPPLVPQLILQFLASNSAGKGVVSRLKRLKKFYRGDFPMAPLRKKRWKIRRLLPRNRKAYLIRFLKDFSRYHRDSQNYEAVRVAMDAINLTTDEKFIQLSRTNNTLYEFLLPGEHVAEKKPIINHVIIKADVRGSTDMTHRMVEKGLNPASYFSLNLFDPITDILSDFGAAKVFVEGDAIILSIFEREETPEGWYSVARACGLAARILRIVRRCNLRNEKSHLPPIELGIGISYHEGSPAFLFDQDHRIMISSAINLADRLSGCSKKLRKQLNNSYPFNLYVFQSATEKERAGTADDLSLRYNVNGIEINAGGFRKLRREIEMKSVCAHNACLFDRADVKLYTGKYPLITGEYQRLVIREGRIPRVNADTLEISELTDRKYYEVCTDPKICQQIRKVCRA